ncbi:DUF2141 domain-containing protein [Caenispirillum salinarum]|uniref:DUF2141 domain-containing protein n=1 Tax=Caenispirillum salinarum TaxID=859058 RepID=UPI00384EE3ED
MTVIRRLVRPLAVISVLAAGAAPLAAQTVDAVAARVAPGITVSVAGVASDRGNVRIAVCTRDEFLKPGCRFGASAPATVGTVTLMVPDVPPGTYAVQAYHDENANAKIDRSIFGAPKEGVGFSNGAKINFGPPKFGDAAVEVGEGEAFTVVPLKYF